MIEVANYPWFSVAAWHSNLPHERIERLWNRCQQVQNLPGSIVEIGVWKGGSAIVLCEAFPMRTVHLFDTFSGMPAIQEACDSHQSGDFSDTSVEAVRELLRRYANCVLHVGLFSDTAHVLDGVGLSFVHLDCDMYQSTKQGLEVCWPLLEPGGMILCDDYGCPSCAGATKAWEDFDFGGAKQELSGSCGIVAIK